MSVALCAPTVFWSKLSWRRGTLNLLHEKQVFFRSKGANLLKHDELDLAFTPAWIVTIELVIGSDHQSGVSDVLIVRCPFREEHLAVCRFFFCIYATLGKMSCHITSHHVTSCHVPSPPVGGYWWLLVLAWDKWSAQMVHQVYGIWAKMSHHIMSRHATSPPPPLSQQLLKVQT